MDKHGFSLLMDNAVGEDVDDVLAVLPISVMVGGFHATHQVGISRFQVV